MKTNKKTKLKNINGPLKEGVVIKKFGVDFFSSGGALTLEVSEVTEYKNPHEGYYSRTHSDGWTIEGEVVSDWCSWVNDFKATHPIYGIIEGNFESEVKASSEKGFRHFYENHKPTDWDYADI